MEDAHTRKESTIASARSGAQTARHHSSHEHSSRAADEAISRIRSRIISLRLAIITSWYLRASIIHLYPHPPQCYRITAHFLQIIPDLLLYTYIQYIPWTVRDGLCALEYFCDHKNNDKSTQVNRIPRNNLKHTNDRLPTRRLNV